MTGTTAPKTVSLDRTYSEQLKIAYHSSHRPIDMDSKQYQKAKKRVKKKKEFRDHLKSFIGVNAVMLGMGLMFGFFNAWLMVVFFWGIGLVFHFMETYGVPGLGNDEEWEEKEMEKELRRMEREGSREEPRQDEIDPDDFLDLDSPTPVKEKSYREEDLV
jgi:hypothetical protein